MAIINIDDLVSNNIVEFTLKGKKYIVEEPSIKVFFEILNVEDGKMDIVSYHTLIIEKIAPEVPVMELTKNEITVIAELLMSELFKKKTQKSN